MSVSRICITHGIQGAMLLCTALAVRAGAQTLALRPICLKQSADLPLSAFIYTQCCCACTYMYGDMDNKLPKSKVPQLSRSHGDSAPLWPTTGVELQLSLILLVYHCFVLHGVFPLVNFEIS